MKNNLKKYALMILALSLVFLIGTNVLGTESVVTDGSIDLELNASREDYTEPEVENTEEPKQEVVQNTTPADKSENTNKTETSKTEDDSDVELNDASETIINSKDKKARRIAELTDKYNDKVLGTVAYYLELAQKYSFPVCFIGLAMGAFNFLIIGNKKLDKKEQGFAWIVGFTIGLVVFNVIPLLFALIVAGR